MSRPSAAVSCSFRVSRTEVYLTRVVYVSFEQLCCIWVLLSHSHSSFICLIWTIMSHSGYCPILILILYVSFWFSFCCLMSLCVCLVLIHLSHLAVAQFGRFVSLGTVRVVTEKVRILTLCRRYVVDERADLKAASDFVDLLTVDKLKGVVNTPWELL